MRTFSRRQRAFVNRLKFAIKTMFHYFKEKKHFKNIRQVSFKVVVYLTLTGVFVLLLILPDYWRERSTALSQNQQKFPTDMKYILLWKNQRKNKKNFYNKDAAYREGQEEFIKQNCPNINCYLSYNASLLGSAKNFDMVIFNIHDTKKFKEIKLPRSPKQLYVFKSFDTAERNIICNKHFERFFNMTWTYRLESDIVQPFFDVHDSHKNQIVGPKLNMRWEQPTKPLDAKYKKIIAGKDKSVACIIKNCKLKLAHTDFLKEFREALQGYNFTLDTYGPCGEQKCPKGGLSKCYKMIEAEYYFNLVLEDSVQPDYVSDKVAKAMMFTAVPIIKGGSNLTSFLPPGSYINAASFTMYKLAAIIDYLIKSVDKYYLFLDWKDQYFYTIRPKEYICDLCTKLVQYDGSNQVLDYIREWWNPEYNVYCLTNQQWYIDINKKD